MLSKIRHIALADDDFDDQEMFIEAIKKASPDVVLTIANDGATLLKILKTIPEPDFIVLDINMPLVNGKECCRVLKNDKSMREVPIMIYSTSSNKTDINEAFSSGADFYVVKPDSSSELNKLAEDIFMGEVQSTVGFGAISYTQLFADIP